MLRSGERVLAAVSAGADSTALACALAELAIELDVSLHLAHFDHCLRPEDAEGDRRFVERLAADLGAPLTCGRRDVPPARSGSLEEEAREARYRFLFRVADETGAARIATGHTRDDQAETVLLHLFRGAGLAGAAGIRPVSRDGRLVRPLLDVSRRDVEAYLRARGRAWREDPSNASDSFTRNRIRSEVLPLVRARVNPAAAEHLARTAARLREAEGLLTRAYRGAIRRILAAGSPVGAEGREIAAADLLTYDPSERAFLIYLLLKELEVGGCPVASEPIERLTELLARDRTVFTVHLGQGWEAVRRYDRLLIRRRADHGVPSPSSASGLIGWNQALEVPGRTPIPGEKWCIRAEPGEPSRSGPDPLGLRVDRDRLEGGLRVRFRRPGDRIRPRGVNGSKKLQDLMVDRKVPRELRDRVPLVVDDAGIIWVPGLADDERVRPVVSSRRIVSLHLEGGAQAPPWCRVPRE
jgi:tRNA(Ile)-lysidine synthase